ncbi:MAG TPA: hypothetical protein VGC51_03915 [Hansschlegelia sp.]
MILRLRHRRAFSLLAGYLFAVWAVLGASAMGAHAARLATGDTAAVLCLNAGGGDAPSGHDGVCADLCRMAGASALAASPPPNALPLVTRGCAAEPPPGGEAYAGVCVPPAARGPPQPV